MPTVYELWRKPMWMMCPMETFVLINNLQLHCPIGVMEQEQVIGNDFCINLRIGYDFTRAMTSDALATRSTMRRSISAHERCWLARSP